MHVLRNSKPLTLNSKPTEREKGNENTMFVVFSQNDLILISLVHTAQIDDGERSRCTFRA